MEHTAEIASTIEGKQFAPIVGHKLPDKFLVDFLTHQGLRLEGAEDIKFLRGVMGEPGPSKGRLEELLRGLENGEVRFTLRPTEE